MTLDERIALAKSQILSDVADDSLTLTDVHGVVSVGPQSFADLHDYVDANFYGHTVPEWEGESEGSDDCHIDVEMWEALQATLDVWIKGGGLAPGLLRSAAYIASEAAHA